MLSRYYGFREEPFGVTPDPRSLYQSSTHCEALASLKYGFSSNRGFIALIAPPGTGKTTLLFRFLEDIRTSAQSAFIFNIDPQCEPREIVSYILRDIGIVPGRDGAEMHEQLHRAVAAEARAGRRFVVVIDEAQNLSDAALEVVRMLTNFETSRSKLMQVVLAGQPQLFEKLMKPSLVQLRQRISTFCRIEPLSKEQASAYIEHRLKAAGYSGPQLFTAEAVSQIADASQGIPRNINNLCFNALSLCCALKTKQVDASMVAEVVADQQLMPSAIGTPTLPPAPALASFSRPERRSSKTTLTWPWVMLSALLIASVLSVLGVSELRLLRSHPMVQAQAPNIRVTPMTPETASSAIRRTEPNNRAGVNRALDAASPDVRVESNHRLQKIARPNLRRDDASPAHETAGPKRTHDPALRDNEARQADLRRQLSDLKSTLTPADYRIQRLQVEISDLDRQLAGERVRVLHHVGVEHADAQHREQFVIHPYNEPQGAFIPTIAHP
jgi:general secretion pathway protein A